MGNRARADAAPAARDARRLPALGKPVGLAPRHRRRRLARPAAVAVRPRADAAGRARRDRRCRRRRVPHARHRRADRGRCRRAGDGAAAGAARSSWLVPPDRPQHRAVPRLVGLRADRDRDRRQRTLRARLRARRHRVLEGPLRRDRHRARLPRPGRLRPPLRAEVRGVDRDRLARLSLVVVAPRAGRPGPLAPVGVARVLAGLRPRAGEHHLVDTARGRLHAILPHPFGGASGARASATSCPRSRSSASAR